MELLRGIIQGDDIMNRLKEKTLPLKNVELMMVLVKILINKVVFLSVGDIKWHLEDVDPAMQYGFSYLPPRGEFYGMVFQDSDVAKWLEAVACLETHQIQNLKN